MVDTVDMMDIAGMVGIDGTVDTVGLVGMVGSVDNNKADNLVDTDLSHHLKNFLKIHLKTVLQMGTVHKTLNYLPYNASSFTILFKNFKYIVFDCPIDCR